MSYANCRLNSSLFWEYFTLLSLGAEYFSFNMVRLSTISSKWWSFKLHFFQPLIQVAGSLCHLHSGKGLLSLGCLFLVLWISSSSITLEQEWSRGNSTCVFSMSLYRNVSLLPVLVVSCWHYKSLKIRAAWKWLMMIFLHYIIPGCWGFFTSVNLSKYTNSSAALLILCHFKKVSKIPSAIFYLYNSFSVLESCRFGVLFFRWFVFSSPLRKQCEISKSLNQ